LFRPKQWIKNSFLAAPIIFSGKFTDPRSLLRVGILIVIYCLLSSAIYAVNDVLDHRADRLHPAKRSRPVASGAVSVKTALTWAVILLGGGLIIAFQLGPAVYLPAAVFVVLSLTYQKLWKKIFILDVIAIAAGFLLRAWAGAIGIGVAASPWFLLSTGLLALFLGFAKRRHELIKLGTKSSAHRPVLANYSLAYLDQLINSLLAASIVTYSLWAFNFGKGNSPPYMMLTIPVVIYALYRYLHLIYRPDGEDGAENIVLADPPLLASIGLWTVASATIIKLFY
jgi:4-hydroxybenzoate polyprenyltransferase